MKRLIICTRHPILFRWESRAEWDGWGM